VLHGHARENARTPLRRLGNDNAHPNPGDAVADQQDAKDVVEFLTQLLIVTYNLPHEIEQY